FDPEQPFVVMGYVDGPTLAQRLREGPLPTREAALIALELALALDHAHARGVIHGDVKPSNVLLDGGSRPVLIDFGAHAPLPAGGMGSADSSGWATPHYMAPELVRGGTPSAATDLFALGAVLHEMISGRRLFDGGKSARETARLVLAGQVPSLAE